MSGNTRNENFQKELHGILRNVLGRIISLLWEVKSLITISLNSFQGQGSYISVLKAAKFTVFLLLENCEESWNEFKLISTLLDFSVMYVIDFI